ncbi:MAG: hypothetical protein KatS3mg093_403 [Candidatus Parcubacteria bacterium]|nr:MAG: hypothetical protein KatS3mg093_403 [Candidatus Parcubacteria bacterium]
MIEVFPEILKIKDNAVAIIIGEGLERKKYENLIEKYSLKDKFFLIGEIKDASRYLKAFDLFVLPSRYEGMSITLIEALFAQIPILASDVGGNKEIVGEECVYGFNNKNDFLIKFQNFQLPPKERVNNFQIDNTINNYLNIYVTATIGKTSKNQILLLFSLSV